MPSDFALTNFLSVDLNLIQCILNFIFIPAPKILVSTADGLHKDRFPVTASQLLKFLVKIPSLGATLKVQI